MNAPGGSSPHPTQETALLAGMNCSSLGEAFCIILQKGTPRNAPRRDPRDWPRAFWVKSGILWGVDQPNSQRGDRRRGGRVRRVRGAGPFHAFSIRWRRGGSRAFAQSSIGMDRNWFETEVWGRDLLSFDTVTATVDGRVREERPLRVRIGSRAHV